MKRHLLIFLMVMSFSVVFSQNTGIWQKQSSVNSVRIKQDKQKLPKNQIYSLDFESLKLALSEAPQRVLGSMVSGVILSFPNSEGQMERFRIVEASNMEAELQSRFPEIRSYAGQGVDDPSAIIRFSISPSGFQSMRLSANEPASFIEPLTDDLSRYSVYKRSDITAAMDDFECKLTAVMNQDINGNLERNADDGILRRYRLAISVTGEYTQYFGGTKANALAAINATMTRVNGVFENDFNVTMVLITNTDAVIYTDPNNDPYSSNDAQWNNQLQNTLNNVIGSPNYDIGHLMGATGNSGNAGCIGCVCVNNQKGSGYTTSTTPTGDNFDIDFVAHEMGHQFGANHTWTFNGNEGTGAQMEPGSGSTIMGYAGITGATSDVQAHSDPYFHAKSIEQVTNYIKTRSCQTNINTENATPSANAGANYTIPKGTPFVLTGAGSDVNSGDVLTYCWEQYDQNNAVVNLPSTTATAGVAFRSYSPTTDTKRYFPRLETIKTGATSWKWEAVPNVARILNFRLTVRDNKLGGASNKSDDTVITVNGTAGPFIVTAPNTNVTWIIGSTQTVTWNIAGTTAAPINCANVDIFLSTDGGNTYPITLATSTPNDGSHSIVVPNNLGFENRIMVKASNNIFFDISNVNFTINVPCTANVPTGFASSNIGSTSAVVSWNQVIGATYDLRYRVVGNPTWTTNTVVGSTSILAGLTPSTNYEAQVRSKCSGGSNSVYSSYVLFTTLPASLYCASNGNDTSDEYIGRVQLNTLDNNNSGPGTTRTGYSDFTAYPALKTDLVGGTQYTITITPVWTGTPYNEGYSVWIDYNHDGDFNDPGEQVFTRASTTNTPISRTFTIPTTISYGQTQMRVALKFNGIPTSCESFNYGEVEDYTVNLMYDGLLYTNNAWIPNAPSDTTSSLNALVLDGTYSVASNIALNNLTLNNVATVDVLPSRSIELNGNLVNNGNLTLNSTSTQYSSLIVNGAVTGDVVYNRHVNVNVNASSGGNDLISAPVTGQTFGVFAAANSNIVSNSTNLTEKLFGAFEKTSGTYLTYDTNNPSEASIVLNPAIGYRAASTDDGTFEFKGTVNTGSVSAGILNTGSIYKPWNLIGNPYPSYIKLSDFLNANINEFLPSSAAVYGYDGDASDGWKIMNLAYSLANPNTIISPGQGFLVASKVGGGIMVFNPSFRTIASGNALLDDDFIEGRLINSDDIGYLKLEMISNSKRSSTDFYVIDGASRGLDIGYDATTFNGVAPNFAIYSHLVEDNVGLDMSIQSVSFEDLNNNLIIPLGVNATQGQQLTISIANTTLPNDVEVYLEDNVANTFTLLNTNDFIFTAESNLSGTGRFFLRFEAPTLNTVDNYLNSILVYATSNPKEIVIKGNLLEATTAHVYDIQGRQVFSQSLDMNKNLQELEATNLSSGVYVIKLQSKNYKKSKKLIIK